MRFCSFLVCLAGCSLLLSACGASNDNVTFKSGGMTHTFAQGSAATKNFPLPIYPEAQPSGSVVVKGDESDDSDFMVLSSKDSADKVCDFYTTRMKADGWTVNKNAFAPGVFKLDAHKQGLEASVMVSADNKETSLSLAVSKESKEAPKLLGAPFTPDKLNPPTD